MKKVFGTVAIALIGGVTAVGAYKIIEGDKVEKVVVRETVQPIRNVSNSSNSNLVDFTYAAENTVNSVVHIKTLSTRTVQRGYDPFGDFFFGPQFRSPQQQQEVAGSGSGVILSNDGYIVTNNHVIKDATEIEVILNDNRTYNATVIGTDPNTDIALIKIDESELPHIQIGNSDDLKVGEWVVAVGNPFNLTSTVTAGIVSAKGRSINILQEQFAIESFIQTDAAVNPGNSGGALVNTNGELVGINTAIASTTGAYAGYSFAVPVNMVKKITDDLISFGTVQRAFIGIQIQKVTKELAEENEISSLKGIYVSAVNEEGAAEEAGIKQGDVVTHVGQVEVNTVPELQEQVSRFRPGDEVNLTIIRKGKEKIMPVILKNKNGSTSVIKKEATVLGASLSEVDEETKEKLNIKNGVRIDELTSGILLRQGIKEGFIILKIDNKEVVSAREVEDLLNSKSGGVLIEGVYPNGTKAFYGFGL
jgi:Do/DeqQ family serine protease